MNPGEFVTPSIRLVRLLRSGGMGTVWVAEHLRLKTEVVVKFITGEFAQHPAAMARFEREARLAAQAKSAHVVQIFDYGISQNGLPYIAMELLEGEDLGARIARAGRVNPLQFSDWFRQICVGLSRAHSKGIVHRDIKPENIFLCIEEGDVLVKLLDFGIAKLNESNSNDFSATKTGAFLGTAYYMSPEQTIGAKGIDLRADLWALGVVAYLALTGVRPFEGETIGGVAIAINLAQTIPPSQLRSDLPVAVDGWMCKALARNPEDRFASAREMARAFEEAITGSTAVDSSNSAASAFMDAPYSHQPFTARSGTTLQPTLQPTPTLQPSSTLSPAVTTPADQLSPSERGPALLTPSSPPGWIRDHLPQLKIGGISLALLLVVAGSLSLRETQSSEPSSPSLTHEGITFLVPEAAATPSTKPIQPAQAGEVAFPPRQQPSITALAPPPPTRATTPKPIPLPPATSKPSPTTPAKPLKPDPVKPTKPKSPPSSVLPSLDMTLE